MKDLFHPHIPKITNARVVRFGEPLLSEEEANLETWLENQKATEQAMKALKIKKEREDKAKLKEYEKRVLMTTKDYRLQMVKCLELRKKMEAAKRTLSRFKKGKS